MEFPYSDKYTLTGLVGKNPHPKGWGTRRRSLPPQAKARKPTLLLFSPRRWGYTYKAREAQAKSKNRLFTTGFGINPQTVLVGDSGVPV